MLTMSRALAPALCLLLAVTTAYPENIQAVKELPQTADHLPLEAEASEPQTRTERCSTCAGSALASGPIPFASNLASRLQNLPPGTEVHSSSSFDGCSTEKGCAGIKVKDGQIIQKYGNIDSFKAASNADTTNEFSFHAGLEGNEVLEGGIPKNGPFWWMKENSPFRDAYGNYEKFSKQQSSTVTSGGGAGQGTGGTSFSASLDLSGNPFLNGDVTKLASGFLGGAQGSSSSASGSFGASQGGIDISNNPYLNGKVKPSGSNTFQSSSFESTYSSSGKDGAGGAIDLSKNPFLAGVGFSSTNKFGAGQTGQTGQVSGGKFSSTSSTSYQGSQNGGQFGSTGSGSNNGAGFGAQGSFQSGQFGSQPSSGSGINKFTSSSSQGSLGYTGSSPSPFTASTGSNVNLIGGTQKQSAFDFDQHQQTQQNIDEIFNQGAGVHVKHEEHNGELQQTCAGQGYICVHKAQCNNGVVNTNGAGILQARTKKQYCNTKTEICCRIEIANIPGSGIDLQGSLGVGSATFGASGSGQSIFGNNANTAGSSAGSNSFGASSSSNRGSTTSGSQFGANGANSGSGFSSSGSFGSSGSTGQFGASGSNNQFGASGSNNQFGSGSNTGAGNGANNGFSKNTFESSSSTYESNRGGSNGANGFGATGSGTKSTTGSFGASGSGSTFGASGSSNSFGSSSTNGFGSGSNAGAPSTGVSGTFGFKETSSSSNSFGANNNNNIGGGLVHIPPPTGGGGVVFKDATNTQTNFIETDSFSAGTASRGSFRPGSNVLKPGIPYLPPNLDVSVGSSNTVSTVSPYIPSPTTRRPIPPRTPAYVPPTTSGPGYLPPQGEQSINRPTFVPGPRAPEDTEGSLLLDQTRQPNRPRQPPFQPSISDIPAGCAAALKCTPIEFCTAEGVISNSSVRLTKDQEDFRVPLTDCRDIERGTVGKCCRDPTYTDPWPTGQLGKWVPGVFGGNDGAYKPDSRGSSNNPTPTRVRPTPGPTTGGLLLNNYRTTEKPAYPYPGPNQVTPGYGQSVTQQTGQSQVSFVGQKTTQGQGFRGQAQGGQIGQNAQGQFGSQNQFGQTVSQGFGQTVTQGQGQSVSQGQGQGVIQGQGQFGQGSQGQFGQGAQGQFGQGSQGQFGQTVTQQTSQTVTQQQGQYGQKGQGQIVSQGQGQYSQNGQGQIVSEGQGQIVSQGQGQIVSQGQGQFGQVGQGQTVTQGQGQFGQRGQGLIVTQGQGQFGQRGQGQIVTQGQGQIISQGEGQIISQGQGLFGQRGQGQAVSQGQGQFGQKGQGQVVSQGQGQIVTQGQGQIITQGQGQFGQSGQGQVVTQGGGAFGQSENEVSESVQRVFLSQYSAGGQCGLQNSQKPFGNRNEMEVDFAEIPWQAMILLETNRSLLCGGVITRPEVVITSAACVDGLLARNVLIKGGEWKLGIDEEPLPFQIVQVKTILRHPEYRRGSLHNDVAILVLAEKLRLANNIFPICLPGAADTLDGFYNGAGECVVTGWGKQVLQVNVAGSIMHSLNISLINPGECQAKISQDYPHLLEQYDQNSCACGQPTNPLNNVCRVDIGSALACTTGDGHFVLRGVYSWDSGCQAGNQLAAFYKFDLEWYEWALGLSEGSGRLTSQYGGSAQTQFSSSQQNRFSGQFNQGGIKGGFNAGIKGGQLNAGIKGGLLNAGAGGQGFTSTSFTQSSSSQFGDKSGLVSGAGAGEAGFGKFSFSSQTQLPAVKYQYETKTPIKGSSYSASYSSQQKETYQSKPQIITYTTKPEIFTYTTKPKIISYTTKPQIISYTTKPQIISYTTKPQIITYETSGSGQNPQYIAPGVTFNPSFSELVGQSHAQAHGAQCKCIEGKK